MTSRRYLRFAATAAAVAAGLVAVGWLPTRRLGGDGAVAAMLAGCGISLAASLGSGLVMTRGAGRVGAQPAAPLFRALGGMGLRLAAVVVLGFAAGLSGYFPPVPLLLWVALSYLALLVVDTRFALEVAATDVSEGPGT